MSATILLCAVSPIVAVEPAPADNGHAKPKAHGVVAPSDDLPRVVGITTPARRAVLSVIRPARIVKVAAPEGTSAREGDIVIVLEDADQRALTEIARAVAESTLAIELARVRWAQSKEELERLEGLRGRDNASSKEMDDARVVAQVTRLEYEIAREEHARDLLAYEREKAVLQEFRIGAPFSGYVSEQHRFVGETADRLEDILTLVQLDPLHVVLDCPLALAPRVRVGDRVRVEPVDPAWSERIGTVALTNRVADGASQTFRVKVAIDNEDAAWMAGLKVVVTFEGLSDAASRSSVTDAFLTGDRR